MQHLVNILLVDDDPTFVFLTKKIIVSTGFETNITEASDGEQAIQFIQQEIDNKDRLPDIILLDLSMPIADGWEFLKEYVLIEPQIQKKITVYIVSSSISPHDVERSKSFEVVKDFVIKPLDKGKLIEILQAATTFLASQKNVA